MLIFKTKTKPLYFIHIPRTGGRYIRDLFLNNNFLINFYRYDEHFMGKEIPHLHYPFYNKFTNFGKIPQFTIVRNPVTRFISTFFASIKKDYLNINVNEIFENKNNFEKFMFQQFSEINYNTNWFLPQVNFINSSCKIWKFEDGFGVDFFKWLKKNFKIEIKDNGFEYKKLHYDFYKKNKLPNKSIDLIKNFYKQDFKLFKYK
jgi:hypothetical protein